MTSQRMQLKTLRKRLGVKLEVLEKLTGYSAGTISRVLNGRRSASPEVVGRIEKTLNDISRVRAGFADVAIDVDDLKWLRRKIAELDQAVSKP